MHIEFASRKRWQARRPAAIFGSEVDVPSSATNTPHRILCVDDRISSLEVRRALLTQKGYDVLIASDPPSALSIFDKVRIDLVLLDYNFPGNISGDELARQLRMRRPGLPLIMLSGFPDLPESVEDGVDVVLLKGSSQPADLLNAIGRLLNGEPVADTQSLAEDLSVRQQNRKAMKKSQELMERSKGQMPGSKT